MDLRTLLNAFVVICSVLFVVDGVNHATKEAEESKTIAVRDVAVEIDYEPVGCYRDKRRDRALSRLVKNFRGSIDLWKHWPDMSSVIQKCAQEAFIQGYTMFGVQFYGECWSGESTQGYNKHGKSPDGCIHGVGKQNVNFIYRIPIPANPVPVKAPNSVCDFEGQTYVNDDSMEVYKGDLASGYCEQCTCKDGKLIDCHHIYDCVLNDSSCDSYSKKPGQCCPSCEKDIPDNAPVCKIKDRVYKEGESMEVLRDLGRQVTSECHQCTCTAGKIQKCHRIYYCDLNRPGCKHFIMVPGQCCPACARVLPKPSPPSCKASGRNYNDGESMEVLKMSDDGKTATCHQCKCIDGKVDECHHIFHCSVNSSNCTSYRRKPDQCCPECVEFDSNEEHAPSCKIHGLAYKHGESAEVLMESPDKSSIYCQQCKCQAGKHTCHKIYDCDIQNGACEKSVKIPGQCCPVCACYNNGQQLEPGDTWRKLSGGDCVECMCNDRGTASCKRVQGGCQVA